MKDRAADGITDLPEAVGSKRSSGRKYGKRVSVVNPGAIQELAYAASAIAQAGLLAAYIAPFAVAPSSIEWLRSRVPAVGPVVADQLRRRPEPHGIGRHQFRRAGSVPEIGVVVGQRLRLPSNGMRPLFYLRNLLIAGAAAEEAGRSGLVLAPHGVALPAFRRIRAVGGNALLHAVTAHHAWAAEILQQEIELTPSFAATLQHHDLPPSVLNSYDMELAEADRILVLSTFQMRTYLERGIAPEKLRLTPLGVNLDIFNPSEVKEGRPFTVLFVGQVTQRKGISYLIEAFHRAALPNSILRFVGPVVGSDEAWRARAGLEYLPVQPRWRLPDIYRDADVYVLPSLVEGFAQTALEAMACGVPVIISTNTFGSDVVTDGFDGFVVPIRDPDAIARKLSLLHSDRDLGREMGMRGSETASKWSWEAYGVSVVAAVKELIGSRI